MLSLPAILLMLGWATPGLATLFAIAFGAVMVRLQWFATKVTLGVPNGVAAMIVALGLVLTFRSGGLQASPPEPSIVDADEIRPDAGAIGPQRERSRASSASRTSSAVQRPAPASFSEPTIERT